MKTTIEEPVETGMYCECGGSYVRGGGTGRTWDYDALSEAYPIPDDQVLVYCANCKHLVLRKSEEDELTQAGIGRNSWRMGGWRPCTEILPHPGIIAWIEEEPKETKPYLTLIK